MLELTVGGAKVYEGTKVGARERACPAELLRAEEFSSDSWCIEMLNDVVGFEGNPFCLSGGFT